MKSVSDFLTETGRPHLAEAGVNGLIDRWASFTSQIESKTVSYPSTEFSSGIEVRQVLHEIIQHLNPPISTSELLAFKEADRRFRQATKSNSENTDHKQWWITRTP